MNIKIYNKLDNELIGEFKVRKNLKNSSIIDKIKEYLEINFNMEIRRLLPTGKIDFATEKSDISYIIFGNNLKYNNIYFVKE